MPDTLFNIIRIITLIAGVALTLWTIFQALRSFVLPRSDRAFLTILVFKWVSKAYHLRFRARTSFDTRDRWLAMLSPVAMFLLPLVWLTLITVGYAAMYWALDPTQSLRDVLILSGSSLLTLGFAYQDSLPIIILDFSQAALGMMLVALLIGYLPTMYSAFSQREIMVTKLETYAGSPPDPVEMIRRMDYVSMLDKPDDMRAFWQEWQTWFVQIEENHTTLAPMNFFRSPKPDRHWLISAGALLDCAAIIASCVDVPRARQGGLVIRSGFLSLRTIGDFFLITYDSDPAPNDPISITRPEFDHMYDRLVQANIPVHADRDMCWDHFAGWRVNYDEVLVKLAALTYPPYGIWSSDRAITYRPEDMPVTEVSALDRVREMRSGQERIESDKDSFTIPPVQNVDMGD
jgi:hypothetical protein